MGRGRGPDSIRQYRRTWSRTRKHPPPPQPQHFAVRGDGAEFERPLSEPGRKGLSLPLWRTARSLAQREGNPPAGLWELSTEAGVMHSSCQDAWGGLWGALEGLGFGGNQSGLGQDRLHGYHSEGPEDGLRRQTPTGQLGHCVVGCGSTCCGGDLEGEGSSRAAIWGACLLSSRRSPGVARSQGEDPVEECGNTTPTTNRGLQKSLLPALETIRA